jgi:F0F1-type ATP synthase assembly protein I
MNDNLEKFKKTIIFITAIISVITAIILLICRKYSWSIGILLGSFVSIITFLMHVNNIDRFGSDIKHPERNAFANSILRLGISAIGLLIAFFISWIDIIATFIGLMIIKVVIFIVPFITTKGIKKEGEDK